MTTSVKLSKRQKQPFFFLVDGLSNRDIAEKMELSEHTVKVHFWRLFKRIGVNSRGQALKWWNDQQPSVSLPDALMLKAAFEAACKFIDGKTSRVEFDFYRSQVEEGKP